MESGLSKNGVVKMNSRKLKVVSKASSTYQFSNRFGVIRRDKSFSIKSKFKDFTLMKSKEDDQIIDNHQDNSNSTQLILVTINPESIITNDNNDEMERDEDCLSMDTADISNSSTSDSDPTESGPMIDINNDGMIDKVLEITDEYHLSNAIPDLAYSSSPSDVLMYESFTATTPELIPAHELHVCNKLQNISYFDLSQVFNNERESFNLESEKHIFS